jgi:hypothetical protein
MAHRLIPLIPPLFFHFTLPLTSCLESSIFCSPKRIWWTSRHWAPGQTPLHPTTASWPTMSWPLFLSRIRRGRIPRQRQRVHGLAAVSTVGVAATEFGANQCWSKKKYECSGSGQQVFAYWFAFGAGKDGGQAFASAIFVFEAKAKKWEVPCNWPGN